MGHKVLRVKSDANFGRAIDFLGEVTGTRQDEEILSDAIAFTATALQKASDGFLIRVVYQSVSFDRFGYPVNPTHLNHDMKSQRPFPGGRDIEYPLDMKLMTDLNVIMKFLKIDSPESAAKFSVFFADKIAHNLNQPSGLNRLVYVDRLDTKFGTIAETPYDRTFKNSFKRMAREVTNWWTPLPNNGKSEPPQGPKP